MQTRFSYILFLLLIAACSSPVGFVQGPVDEPASNTSRPTEAGEGIPGYIARPRNMNIQKSGDKLQVSAPVGTFKANGDATVASLRVKFWVIDGGTLQEMFDSTSDKFEIAESPIAVVSPNADGSMAFENTLTESGIVVFAVVRSDSQSFIDLAQVDSSSPEDTYAAFKDLESSAPPAPVDEGGSGVPEDVTGLRHFVLDGRVRAFYDSSVGNVTVQVATGGLRNENDSTSALSVFAKSILVTDMSAIETSMQSSTNLAGGSGDVRSCSADGSYNVTVNVIGSSRPDGLVVQVLQPGQASANEFRTSPRPSPYPLQPRVGSFYVLVDDRLNEIQPGIFELRVRPLYHSP